MKKKLTQRQEQTMQRHSRHHTPRHMSEMTKLMLQGKSFEADHKIAMKKVGR